MKWPWSNDKETECPICGSDKSKNQQTCGKASCKGKVAHMNYPNWFKEER